MKLPATKTTLALQLAIGYIVIALCIVASPLGICIDFNGNVHAELLSLNGQCIDTSKEAVPTSTLNSDDHFSTTECNSCTDFGAQSLKIQKKLTQTALLPTVGRHIQLIALHGSTPRIATSQELQPHFDTTEQFGTTIVLLI